MPVTDPSVSVITACLKCAGTIGETIESVARQGIDRVEYLVVDGGSLDGTLDIVKERRDVVAFWSSEADSGIASAFNKGIRAARGEIVSLLNADDAFLPGALAMVVQYFEANPTTDVVHADVLLYNEETFIKRLAPSGRWWYPWRLVLFNHPATFVRRRVYDKCGLFDEDYRLAMDVELFLRWKANGIKIDYLRQPLVKMRTGGASTRNAARGCREARRALLRYGYNRIGVETQYVMRLLLLRLLALGNAGRG